MRRPVARSQAMQATDNERKSQLINRFSPPRLQLVFLTMKFEACLDRSGMVSDCLFQQGLSQGSTTAARKWDHQPIASGPRAIKYYSPQLRTPDHAILRQRILSVRHDCIRLYVCGHRSLQQCSSRGQLSGNNP